MGGSIAGSNGEGAVRFESPLAFFPINNFWTNVEPGVTFLGGKSDGPGSDVFRKHRRPCGQPAVAGGIGSFRPVPSQIGHLARMNATPSDLPLRSTGFAIYPAPPQFGQSFEPTPVSPPSLNRLCLIVARLLAETFSRYETRTNSSAGRVLYASYRR